MREVHDDGPPLFAYAAVAVFVALFAAQFSQADLSHVYSKLNSYAWRVAEGEWWRLITCSFLHGSVLHIAFNTTLFLRFGRTIDLWLGPWMAMLMYAAIAMSSNAAQMLVMGGGVVVGASGVVYGFFGFLWVMSRRRDDAADAVTKHIVETMFGWLGVCFLINVFGGNIANTAHLWGLLLGWMTGQAVVARRKWRVPLIVATLIVWALPIVATQRAVWEKTLSHVPWFRNQYRFDESPEEREAIEHPERPWRPGFM